MSHWKKTVKMIDPKDELKRKMIESIITVFGYLLTLIT